MGRKRSRTGKYIYFCFTVLILSSLLACSTLQEMASKQYAQDTLIRSQDLLAKRDFKEALKENQKVLSLFIKGPPGDEAIFNMGLIYAHYKNPDRDYNKAVVYFKLLIKEYPKSPLVEQAKIWRNVLRDKVEPTAKKTKEPSTNNYLLLSSKYLEQGKYEKSLKESRRILANSSKKSDKGEALFSIALVYAHYNNPDKDFQKAAEYFAKLIKEYPGSPLIEQAKIWLNVLDVIEKAKQVDIEIEIKKKELAR